VHITANSRVPAQSSSWVRRPMHARNIEQSIRGMTERDVMAYRLLASVILLGASLAAVGPVLAQAPPEARTSSGTSPVGTPAAQGSDSSAAPTQSPTAPGAPTTTATPTEAVASPPPTAPSADTLKRARLAGYRPETSHGVARFCRQDNNLGTRFATKKCIDEDELHRVLDIHNQEQDSLRRPLTCAGSGCTAH
jgi:hypothetical protein